MGPERAALRPKRVPGRTVSRSWSEVKRKRVLRWCAGWRWRQGGIVMGFGKGRGRVDVYFTNMWKVVVALNASMVSQYIYSSNQCASRPHTSLLSYRSKALIPSPKSHSSTSDSHINPP